MISVTDLAEVIRDNIEPGEGPLGDLWLDCANAVLAAIEGQTLAPSFRGPEGQDALDAARFRFIRDVLAQSFEYDTAGLIPGSARLHVKMDAVAIVEKSALAGVRTGADALPVVLNAMMRGFPQYQPGDRDLGRSTLISEPKVSIPMPEGAAVPPTDPLTGTLGAFECQYCRVSFIWFVADLPKFCPCCPGEPKWRRLPNAAFGGVHQHRFAPESPRSGMSDDEREMLSLTAWLALVNVQLPRNMIHAGFQQPVEVPPVPGHPEIADRNSVLHRVAALLERIKP